MESIKLQSATDLTVSISDCDDVSVNGVDEICFTGQFTVLKYNGCFKACFKTENLIAITEE